MQSPLPQLPALERHTKSYIIPISAQEQLGFLRWVKRLGTDMLKAVQYP